MNILVVGCGKVGSKLASTLSREGHDVSVVDKDEQKFELLDNDFSGFTTAGIPIDQDVLRRAGIEDCDAVAAVSEDDNVNIMVSQLAEEIFHIPKVIARIYDPQRENVFSHYGLHTVCPTNLTVGSIKAALINPRAVHNLNFGSSTVSFMTIPVPKSLIEDSVSKLEFDDNESLFGILRGNQDFILYQGQRIILHANDLLVICTVVD